MAFILPSCASSIISSGEEISPFQGKRIVLTGTVPDFTRNELKELLEKLGARVTSSVSASTDMVIAGENPGSKLGKAVKLGVKVVPAGEVLQIFSRLRVTQD